MTITRPSFNHESHLWNSGYEYVIGIDEVGRGAFAGPVVAAGVIFPKSVLQNTAVFLNEINDSKLLSAKKRESLVTYIQNSSLFSYISTIPVSKINKVGIGKATYCAFREVLSKACDRFENNSLFVLSDGFAIPFVKKLGKKRQTALIKGDRISISIAAASIIAKVHRDALMSSYHVKFPHYNFRENKGYGTNHHRQALKIHGLSNLHRKSFDLSSFLT